MRRYIHDIVGFLQRNVYPLLLLAAGLTAVLESIRITNKYKPSNWFSGPSGFMMIIGVILLLLLVFELAVRTLSQRKINARLTAASMQPDTGQADTSQASDTIKEPLASAQQSAEETAEKVKNTRNMCISFFMLIIYTLTIRYLGFSVTSALYLGANMLLLGNSKLISILTAVIVAVLLSFGAPAMGLSLPRGLIGF